MTGSASIIRANARDLPLPDNSVDLVVTSPPYFALRSYQDGGEHYDGQIGSEPTPAEFVAALLEVTRECVRVLKPSGSLWVNLGDKYSTGSSGMSDMARVGEQYRGGGHAHKKAVMRSSPVAGMKPKSLIGIPWRYALACIDDLGLILRAEVIWSKPNGLPESVTDRVRRSHEQWFHFTLQPRYFSAVDEIREEHANPNDHGRAVGSRYEQGTTASITGGVRVLNPLGKLPGSVWTVPTQPLRVPEHLGVDHFAAFPMTWPRRIIQGWSPSGVCVECGEGRRPVSARSSELEPGRRTKGLGSTFDPASVSHHPGDSPEETSGLHMVTTRTITGYACACPEPIAPTTPATVLDPFGGTGTTALVAKALGRHGISVDMSADYCRLATWRTNDPGELARAMQVDKPAEQVKGQADLFDLIEGAAS